MNFHNLSIRLRLGEYDGRNNSERPTQLRVVTIIDSGLIKIIDGLSSKWRAA